MLQFQIIIVILIAIILSAAVGWIACYFHLTEPSPEQEPIGELPSIMEDESFYIATIFNPESNDPIS
jgi:hypothetical protein